MTNDISRRTLVRGLGTAALALPMGRLAHRMQQGRHAGVLWQRRGGPAGPGRKRRYLRVAIANEPPYTKVNPDGTVTGAEPDVFGAVCKRLGIPDIQGVITPYASMIPGLNANRWDAITAASS